MIIKQSPNYFTLLVSHPVFNLCNNQAYYWGEGGKQGPTETHSASLFAVCYWQLGEGSWSSHWLCQKAEICSRSVRHHDWGKIRFSCFYKKVYGNDKECFSIKSQISEWKKIISVDRETSLSRYNAALLRAPWTPQYEIVVMHGGFYTGPQLEGTELK